MTPGQTLPAGWCWTTLGAIADLKGGLTKGKRRKDGDRLRSVPYLRVANVQRGYLDLDHMKLIDATEKEIEELRLRAGDVLFNEGGDRDKLGRGWVWQDALSECIHQNHVFRARLRDSRIEPKFVSWYANGEGAAYFNDQGKQTTNLASINLTRLSEFPLPLAPDSEQRRIVAELESQFTRLDAAISSLRHVKLKLNRLRAAVLHAACAGRIGSTRNSRWARCLLADVIGEIRNGISVKPNSAEGLRILRISSVRPLKADIGDVRFLPGISPEFEPYLLRPGDLLFTRYNGNPDYVGVAACLKQLAEPTVYPDKLIRVRLADAARVLPCFLEIILNAGHAREFLRSRIRTTAGQSGISGHDVRLTPISFPDLPEQEQIIAEVQSRISSADLVERTVDINLKRAGRLRQAILKRAFEGRLVPPDPNDEPAEILLERARANGHSRRGRRSAVEGE